jgi:hypothetical protein
MLLPLTLTPLPQARRIGILNPIKNSFPFHDVAADLLLILQKLDAQADTIGPVHGLGHVMSDIDDGFLVSLQTSTRKRCISSRVRASSAAKGSSMSRNAGL